jgi:hypothetical protein
MIDFTTIQANPIPPEIIKLQASNRMLKNEKELLQTCLIVGGIALGLIILAAAIKKMREKQNNKTINNENEN